MANRYKYGLIGLPLEHSFSQKYFSEKFIKLKLDNYIYSNFPIKNISNIRSLIEQHNLSGLNVTSPYKEAVLNYVDELCPIANATGIINTLKILHIGNRTTIKGYNTDAYGFNEILEKIDCENFRKAIILGSGGSGKTVKYVLEQNGINVIVVSRTANKGFLNYSDIDKELVESSSLIINTTPVGMFPNIDKVVNFPFKLINETHTIIDLIYNPLKSVFLQLSEDNNAKIFNGFDMLIGQAEKSWEIWTSDL